MTHHEKENLNGDTCRLLSTRIASHYISMSEHWLKAARFRPELAGPRFCKLGRCVRYDIDDLNEWLEERKFRGTFEFGRVVK
jgi:hypothetical protein